MMFLFSLIAIMCMFLDGINASHLNKFDVHDSRLQKCIDTAAENNERLIKLETKHAQFAEIEAKRGETDAAVAEINEAKEKRLMELETKFAQYEFLLSDNMRQAHEQQGEKLANEKVSKVEQESISNSRHKRALSYEGDPIAFTAYLDHDLNSIGQHENLVFGHVLLNDGNGYNMHTGAFTVPVTGVYHFDFFIGERNVNQIYVWLSVNNTNEIDAVAESAHDSQDIQGGNAANLKLAKGDVVFLKHYLYGTHLEGANDVRISSFSGFLLYPTESVSIVGK